ncbi:MAG: hypothetical protein AAF433_13580 [Bacteroidota bacterium]
MTLANRRLRLFLAVPLLLLVPLIAMQFTTEVNWSAMDFLLAGVLLVGVALAIDFLWEKGCNGRQRGLLLTLLLLVFLLAWAELAVGVLGTPFAGS